MSGWPDIVDAIGTGAIVLLTLMLWSIERHRSRAVIDLRAPHSREHYRLARLERATPDNPIAHKIREREPGRGIWFLLQNRGGVDCTVDMGKSYVMLDRQPYKERKDPWWLKHLDRYWQDRIKERRDRIGCVAFLFALLQGKKRWQTESIAVYSQDHWLDLEIRHRPRTYAELKELSPPSRELQDITIAAGQAKAYVAEYSLYRRPDEPEPPRARRAILVVRPMIGSPARMQFVAHEHG